MATNYDEQIQKMYDANISSQKESLASDYKAADSDYAAQQEKARKAAEQNIQKTKIEAQRAAMNNEEYYAANGLTSGAKAQARLALNNQMQSDISTIRAAQQESDAEIQRQRGLLAQEYASAIRKAQADNDLARAQALYTEAKDADSKLLAKQEASAQLLAQAGDFSGYGTVYGMTPEQVQSLTNEFNRKRNAEIAAANASAVQAQLAKDKAIFDQKLDVAKLLAEETGDYTALGNLYGLSENEIAKLNGTYSSYDAYIDDLNDGSLPTPTDTENTRKFIQVHGTIADMLRRGMGSNETIKAYIEQQLDKYNLTPGEFRYLRQQYGLE